MTEQEPGTPIGQVFYLRWARLGDHHAHSETPTLAACEAEGWRIVGADPRYGNSVLVRKDGDA